MFLWGVVGVPKTVKLPNYFRKTLKPPLNSATNVITSFYAVHLLPWFYVIDYCLVTFLRLEKGKPYSNALSLLERVNFVDFSPEDHIVLDSYSLFQIHFFVII